MERLDYLSSVFRLVSYTKIHFVNSVQRFLAGIPVVALKTHARPVKCKRCRSYMVSICLSRLRFCGTLGQKSWKSWNANSWPLKDAKGVNASKNFKPGEGLSPHLDTCTGTVVPLEDTCVLDTAHQWSWISSVLKRCGDQGKKTSVSSCRLRALSTKGWYSALRPFDDTKWCLFSF